MWGEREGEMRAQDSHMLLCAVVYGFPLMLLMTGIKKEEFFFGVNIYINNMKCIILTVFRCPVVLR